MSFNKNAPVLVTGGTGYVAGWVVKALLEAGLTVHAAVRNPAKKEKVQHLLDLADDSPGSLKLFAADLLASGSYAEAMAGCDVVFHTASPFTTRVDDPQTELVDPALNGTRNVLDTVNATSSVRRVVLTSSCAAIYTDASDCAQAPGGVLTEEIWNTTASLDYQPYSYSKLLAEREAWKIADSQDRWDLVVINPSLVIGPALNPNPTSESFAIVKQLGDGNARFGAPKLGMGVVDVRDVAQAHIEAANNADANGRNILSGHSTNFLEIGQVLQDRFGKDYPLPTRALPKRLVWLVGPYLAGLPRQFVANNVDVEFVADNSKSRRELGIEYRPLKGSMEDMFAQMIDSGAFA